MNRIQRLAAAVAELRAGRVARAAAPLAAKELREAGFTVYPFPDGDGLAVEQAPRLSTKLDDLGRRGIRPALVAIIRDLSAEHASGTAETAKASNGDRSGGATPGAQPPTASATPGARVTDPTTKNGSKHV